MQSSCSLIPMKHMQINRKNLTKKAVKLFISMLFAMLPLCGCGSDMGAVISKTELSVSDFSASDTTAVSAAATAVTTTTTTTTAALQLTTCSTSVYCKDSAQLEVSYGDAVRWQSSDTSVAGVDKNGKVTTERAGSAVITAYDSEGNSASCTVESIKVVYLTIDDSPGDYTQSILDTLAEYDIKATFFICGPYSSEKRYNAIISGGHTIANHTKTHEKDVYDSFNALYSEVKAQAETIKKYTGREALKIFRFPGGSKGHGTYAKRLRSKGYHVFDWTATLGDTASNATPESCLANVKKYTTEDREILLMHHKSHSAKALPQIIEYLLEQGYTFAPITMDTTPYSFA